MLARINERHIAYIEAITKCIIILHFLWKVYTDQPFDYSDAVWFFLF